MLVTITETLEIEWPGKKGKRTRFHAGELADLPEPIAVALAGRGRALYVVTPSLETLAKDAASAAARLAKKQPKARGR